MSLKDDFLEALNSVKRDFLKDNPIGDDQDNIIVEARGSNEEQSPVYTSAPALGDETAPPSYPDEFVFDAFQQASVIPQSANDIEDEDMAGDDLQLHSDVDRPSYSPPTYRSYEPGYDAAHDTGGYNAAPPEFSRHDDEFPAVTSGGLEAGRRTYDFDQPDLYSNDKTVISKNTVIRGTIQTDDSLRLLGQVMGDIDCKSNIVIAGKVRGNTTAANAYVMDAQVDGSLQCDDVVSVSSDAWVLGNVRAQQAEIDGKIKGNLDIRHAISIGGNSSIIGNISTDELEIQRGAFVNGQIMMYTPSRDVLDKFEHFEK